jgi:hypothetical protein
MLLVVLSKPVLAGGFFQSWSANSFPVSMIGVAFGNKTFCAVGDDLQAVTTLFYISTDGRNWIQEQQPPVLSTALTICFGNDRFVVGGFGFVGTSTNGTNWTFKKTSTNTVRKIIATPGNFLAVTPNRVGTSSDGLLWNWMSPLPLFLGGVAFGNGMRVVGGTARLHFAGEDEVWHEIFFPDVDFQELSFGKDRFVALGQLGPLVQDANDANRFYGTNQLWLSYDGKQWTNTYSVFGDQIRSIAYGDGLFVAGGSGGSLLWSTDGIHWNLERMEFNTRNLSFAGNRMFSAFFNSLNSSTELLTLTANASSLEVYGPIGKTIRLLHRSSIERLPEDFIAIELTDMPTVLPNPPIGFVNALLQ